MSDPVMILDVPFAPDAAELFESLHVDPGGEDAAQVCDMAAHAARIGRPKAIYRECYVEQNDGQNVRIDGVPFSSRVLSVNLGAAHRVFPYVATCGMELAEWAKDLGLLQTFWAEAIMLRALAGARVALDRRIKEINPGRTATMNPGSLPDWPITEQRPLFALVGDPARDIGVTLTESLLMLPTKSVSGIRFPAETAYENCQLCRRPACPGRRAPYDPSLLERKYRKATT